MSEQDRLGGDPTVTDVRFPERWMYDRRLRKLSGDGFRLFMMGMAWSVSQRTDGVIPDVDLPDVPYVEPELINDLEAHGLWRRDGDRWVIEDFAGTQTNRRELERLEAIRRADRERKSRQRAQAASMEVPPDVPRDVQTDTPRRGKAKAKLGQEDLPPTETEDFPDDTDFLTSPLAEPPAPESTPKSGIWPLCTKCGNDPGSFSPVGGLCRKCRFG